MGRSTVMASRRRAVSRWTRRPRGLGLRAPVGQQRGDVLETDALGDPHQGQPQGAAFLDEGRRDVLRDVPDAVGQGTDPDLDQVVDELPLDLGGRQPRPDGHDQLAPGQVAPRVRQLRGVRPADASIDLFGRGDQA